MVMVSNAAGNRTGPPNSDQPADRWHDPGGSWAACGQVSVTRPPSDLAAIHAQRLSALAGAIEDDILPRLMRNRSGSTASANESAAASPTPAEVQAFTQHLIARDEPALQRGLAALRQRGVLIPVLMTHLLAPAARHLGLLWERDECHFAEVTIGVGRLQQIMRALSSEFGTEIDPLQGGRRVLLMAAPGEQHTFGLSMVGEFFARAGWEVAGVPGPGADSFQDKVASEWFDLVGISAGSTVRLADVRACVSALRQHSHNRRVLVLVGGPLFLLHPELNAEVQADAVVGDGAQAPRLAAELLDRPAARRR